MLPMLLAKVTWADDWVSNLALNTAVEPLLGTSFTVNYPWIAHGSAIAPTGALFVFRSNGSSLNFVSDSELYGGLEAL